MRLLLSFTGAFRIEACPVDSGDKPGQHPRCWRWVRGRDMRRGRGRDTVQQDHMTTVQEQADEIVRRKLKP